MSGLNCDYLIVDIARHVGLHELEFFFFKQKTAYEIMPSLVGSEMCIRDRCSTCAPVSRRPYSLGAFST